MKRQWSRREFLTTTAAAVVLGTGEKALAAGTGSLPKRQWGITAEMISCVGFGSGTRFCSIESEDAAQALLEKASLRASITSLPLVLTPGAASNG